MRRGRTLPGFVALILISAPLPSTAQITLPTAPVGPAAPMVAQSWGLPGASSPFPALPTGVQSAIPAGPQGLIPGFGEILAVVPLRYADVSEVVGLLTADQSLKPNDTFTPEEPNFGSAGGQTFYGSGLPSSPVAAAFNANGLPTDPVGRDVNDSIGVDRRLNAVVLKGTPERVAAIKAAIASLDQPVTSVVLETVFVELTETGARNLGLDFNNANNQIATATYVLTSGFPGVANTPRDGGVSVNMQAALYAQIAKGQGKIVSKPRIAAQSGGTAKIVTGDALPILTSIALSGVNAVQQQVQYVNVGVTLQIAPRVSDDGMVTSHVFAVISSVTGFSQGYPTISQREASTSATVRDGESFVIGGLSQETDLKHHSKLPILGDVPVLSSIINTENSTKSKTDLYVVITPHIVRGQVPPDMAPPPEALPDSSPKGHRR
ncbi:MAG TPA: secretin N-terminal domain-containing protein [Caulobacteraceae bacterium]|jgi:general secretion pathway protein D